eukprot:CAMPEP_0184523692 /NCGR_PEP_ID=MMETSP0198_2-20121128/9040_1 /TAXON_ID=1112570 /ORGANISM="Thraustochytrium sp., Strain LLF1b" /LENGTH=255 /DNA_ID=CAMNT_0026914781 /DNA_START=687 /DNA_END=1451 /DNA_ORIENTATION=+
MSRHMELESDLKELSTLLAQVRSQRLKSFLEEHHRKLTKELALQEAEIEIEDKTCPPVPNESYLEPPRENSCVIEPSDGPSSKHLGPTPPAAASAVSAQNQQGKRWKPITKFAFDQNKSFVQLYIDTPGVGKLDANNVSCSFCKDSFDLRIIQLQGENLRLVKTQLEKDIVPEKSKFKIKENSVVVYLKKVDAEFGPEHWNNLTSKKKSAEKASGDPLGGVMDILKDMYDEGDDKLKATIGEAMLKSRSGTPSFG